MPAKYTKFLISRAENLVICFSRQFDDFYNALCFVCVL
jgi:hypothetical protein